MGNFHLDRLRRCQTLSLSAARTNAGINLYLVLACGAPAAAAKARS